MKGAVLPITRLALLAICQSSAGADPPTPQFRVTIESGRIVVTDANNGAYMGGTTFEKFGVTSTSTQDKLRHVALDTVAAVVAGNRSREHSVAPDVPVYTVAEVKENKAPMPTGTLEHGFVFVLLSDTQANGRYEALVYMNEDDAIKRGEEWGNQPQPTATPATEPIKIKPMVSTGTELLSRQHLLR